MERNIKMKFYCIKDNFKIIKIMVLEHIFLIVVDSMKVNGKIMKQMEMEYIFMMVVISMKVNGKIINVIVMDN